MNRIPLTLTCKVLRGNSMAINLRRVIEPESEDYGFPIAKVTVVFFAFDVAIFAIATKLSIFYLHRSRLGVNSTAIILGAFKMNKFAPIALLATVATIAVIPSAVFAAEASQSVQAVADTVAAAPAVTVKAGTMLYGPDANRIASIYRVTSTGDAQVILNGRLLTVPAATLSNASGKTATNLTKSQILRR